MKLAPFTIRSVRLPISVRFANAVAATILTIMVGYVFHATIVGIATGSDSTFGAISDLYDLARLDLRHTVEINTIGICMRFGPATPHPPGGPIGQPVDVEGFFFLGLSAFHYSLEWRNAGIYCPRTMIVVPWWTTLMPVVVRPLYRTLNRFDEGRLLNRKRERQIRANQARVCTECGYDLRATPHRCPECGTVPGKV